MANTHAFVIAVNPSRGIRHPEASILLLWICVQGCLALELEIRDEMLQ